MPLLIGELDGERVLWVLDAALKNEHKRWTLRISLENEMTEKGANTTHCWAREKGRFGRVRDDLPRLCSGVVALNQRIDNDITPYS